MAFIVIPIVLFLLGALALLRLNAAAIAALTLVLIALVFGMAKIWTILFVVLAIATFSASYFMKDEAEFVSKRATLDVAWKNIWLSLVTIWLTWRPEPVVQTTAQQQPDQTQLPVDDPATKAAEPAQSSESGTAAPNTNGNGQARTSAATKSRRPIDNTTNKAVAATK